LATEKLSWQLKKIVLHQTVSQDSKFVCFYYGFLRK